MLCENLACALANPLTRSCVNGSPHTQVCAAAGTTCVRMHAPACTVTCPLAHVRVCTHTRVSCESARCIRIHPDASTCSWIRQYPDTSTCIHMHPHASTCIHMHPHPSTLHTLKLCAQLGACAGTPRVRQQQQGSTSFHTPMLCAGKCVRVPASSHTHVCATAARHHVLVQTHVVCRITRVRLHARSHTHVYAAVGHHTLERTHTMCRITCVRLSPAHALMCM